MAHGEHWGAAGGSINAQMSSAFVRKSLGLEIEAVEILFFFVCGGEVLNNIYVYLYKHQCLCMYYDYS